MEQPVVLQSPTDASSLDADAFRKLYPEHYYQRFLDDGIRPDGRTLGRSRATTIGLGTITSVDGSALVKQGNTTVVAGVRSSLGRPSESSPGCGSLTLNVELAPFSSADWRPGRAPELVSTVSERLNQVLLGCSSSSNGGGDAGGQPGSAGAFPLQQLCLVEGKASWALTLDVYVLNADGAVFDAVLLAAVAALAGTQLPATVTSPEGEVKRQRPSTASSQAPASTSAETTGLQASRTVVLDRIPLALTCSLYRNHVLVDPTSEEEVLAGSLVTVVMDQRGTMHGIFKPGGGRATSQQEMLQCVQSAKLRHKEVSELLQQALEEHRGDAML